MTQSYRSRDFQGTCSSQTKRSVHFDQPEHANGRKNKDLPRLPTSQGRRKLRKTRTVYEVSQPNSGMPKPFPSPLHRSESTVSEDSAGHLLQSEAANRANHARYPRSSQPTVLRKRRRDAGRRYHSFPPTNHTKEIKSILQPPRPTENLNSVPVGQAFPQEQFGRNPPLGQASPNDHRRHSVAISENVLSNASPSTTSQRRWSMLDSTNVAASNVLGSTVVPLERNKGKDRELPPLPESYQETEQEPEASTSRRATNLPPLPLYSEASDTVIDSSHQQRLYDDLLQGERTYLDTLRQCVKNEDIFATSLELLLTLLSLIQIGEDFTNELTASSTPEGVASAFLSICRPLETALVKWSEEIARIEADNPESTPQPSTPLPSDRNPRRHSILKRVSVLWSRKSKRHDAARVSNTIKPDRVWAKNGPNPGLWEMSVLPARRVTQYCYLLRELLSTFPQFHPSFSEFERAYHVSTFISEKITRAQAVARI